MNILIPSLILLTMLVIVWIFRRPMPNFKPAPFEKLTFNLSDDERIEFDKEDIRTLKRLATFYRDLHKVIPVHEP